MVAARKQVTMAAAALVAGLSAPAFAADNARYLLASVGVANFNSFDPDPQANSKKTTSLGAWKLGGGYLFGVDLGGAKTKLGVEAGYVDFGKAKLTFSAGDETVKSTALYVAAVGVMPINDRWSAHAKLGMASGSTKVDPPGGASSSGSSVKPMFGIGGQFELDRELGVRAEFEAYQAGKKGDATNNSLLTKINMLSVGIVYKIGN